VLYATKNTKIQTSNNISENIQGKVIEYLKNIEPKDFDTLESLIKTRYNGNYYYYIYIYINQISIMYI